MTTLKERLKHDESWQKETKATLMWKKNIKNRC